MKQLERLGLGFFPTPFEKMERLSANLRGPGLFVKRDDLTGLAMGGNKIRQLDSVLVEPRKQKSDVVITACGVQSNWARQVVGAAARLGMKSVVILRTLHFKQRPRVYDGNTLLDYILGADVKVIKMKMTDDPAPVLHSVEEKLRKQGHNPYLLYETYKYVAAAAYAECVKEISEQSRESKTEVDAIVAPCGSGSTIAGVALGVKIQGMKSKVIGVGVGDQHERELTDSILETANGGAKLLELDVTLGQKDVQFTTEYGGRGYGIPTKESIQALTKVARTEGLILDPVYTSKAMACVFDLVRRGEFKRDDNVCFVHTGGTPALFAYKSFFQPRPINAAAVFS